MFFLCIYSLYFNTWVYILHTALNLACFHHFPPYIIWIYHNCNALLFIEYLGCLHMYVIIENGVLNMHVCTSLHLSNVSP